MNLFQIQEVLFCNSIEVTCSNDHLEICSKNISKTCHLIEWTDEQLKTIQYS